MVLLLLPRAKCVSLLGISSSIEQVKQIHAQMIINALLHHPPNLAKLIERYFAVEDGSGYALLARAISPDKFTYTYALRACARSGALREGKQTQARVIKSGLVFDVAVQTTAIHFYAICKDIFSARKLFDEMPERSSVTWNAMLTGYCTNGFVKETLILFREMLCQGVRPTERTAVPLISACSQLGDLAVGSSVHGFIYKSIPYHEDCFIGTGLVDMYSKCGSLDNAWKFFCGMRERNVLSWTAMMAGLAMHGEGKAALELMDEMQRVGVQPNEVTFTCVLSACCHAGLLEDGAKLFGEIKKRFGLELRVEHYGCMVDLLGRAGLVGEAREIVRGMAVEPDVVVWRALLSACKVHGRMEIGEEVGKKLLRLERGDGSSCEDFVALSNVYASAERWEDVWMVREMMRDMGVQNKAGCSSIQSVQSGF